MDYPYFVLPQLVRMKCDVSVTSPAFVSVLPGLVVGQ